MVSFGMFKLSRAKIVQKTVTYAMDLANVCPVIHLLI